LDALLTLVNLETLLYPRENRNIKCRLANSFYYRPAIDGDDLHIQHKTDEIAKTANQWKIKMRHQLENDFAELARPF